MDGTRFDQLIKGIATQRVSRLTALRGLAAGAVASFTGLSLFGEDGEAKKDGKKKRTRRICHRTSATDPGITKKVKAKRAKKHLRNHQFDTKGRCQAVPAPPTTTRAPLPPPPQGFDCRVSGCTGQFAGLVCDANTGQCVFCESFAQCPIVTVENADVRQACIGGFCVGGESCTNDPQCAEPLECIDPDFATGEDDEFCLLGDECEEDSECDEDEACVAGDCRDLCVSGGNCFLFQECQGGVCVPFT